MKLLDNEKTLEKLREQYKNFAEQEEYCKTMKLKALGAIEVLEQLELKEKEDKE